MLEFGWRGTESATRSPKLMPETLSKEDLNRFIIAADKTAEVGRSYVAIEKDTGRPFWVRLVTASGESKKMLAHDLEVAARLQHPNLVKLKNYGIFDREVVAVYEWLPGFSLREIAPKLPSTNPTQIAERIVPPLILGIHELHQANIAHWGIDPTNVLITANGQVKIADVGLAATYRDHLRNVAIAPPFAPPELKRGEPQIDSDYYSVSALMTEVAGDLAAEIARTAARLPMVGWLDAVKELLEFVNNLRRHRGQTRLSKPLTQVLQRFLSIDPRQRRLTDQDLRLIEEGYSRVHWDAAWPRIDVIHHDVIGMNDLHRTLLTEVLESRKRTAFEERRSEELQKIVDAVVTQVNENKTEREVTKPKDGMQPTNPPGGRFVNLWTDAETPALSVGDRWYVLSLQIAASSGPRMLAPFEEPALQGDGSTELLVSFYSDDLEIESHHCTILLPAHGNSEIATSRIRPRHAGPCKLEIMISLARELEILQVLEADIAAAVVVAPVTAGAVA